MNKKHHQSGRVPHNKLPDGLAVKNSIYRNFASRSNAKGLEWALQREDVFELIVKECYYCGTPPSGSRRKDPQFKYGSIDRVDSSGGYTPSNVVPCCSRCNYAKLAMKCDDFMSLMALIVKNLNKKEPKWRTIKEFLHGKSSGF